MCACVRVCVCVCVCVLCVSIMCVVCVFHVPSIHLFLLFIHSFPPLTITGPNSNQWLRDALAQYWSTWLPSDTTATIKKLVLFVMFRNDISSLLYYYMLSFLSNLYYLIQRWILYSSDQEGTESCFTEHELL